MKKIVHVIIGLNVGGAELMLKRLVLHSQQKGNLHHEVISLTDLGAIGQDLKEAGIRVYTLNMSSLLSIFSIYFSLKKLLKEIKPDIVQTWMYHADFLGGLAAKSLDIQKIIWGIRTTDVTQGASRLTVVLRKICAKLSYSVPTDIVCAAHVSKDVHIKIGYDASKMHVIPNGFELDKLVATEEDRNKIRQEFNIPKEATVIGSVGRFNVVKNQIFFVEVANQLVKTYPKLIFMLIGRDNTIENSELMNWLRKYNLINNFRLLGQRNDIPACLKAMDIFCLHSKTEGFPNVLGEAMGLGVMAVSTNVGDVPYLIDQEFIGSDLINMASIICNILENRIDIGKTIVSNKNKIDVLYSMDKLIFNYELVYLEKSYE
ncbi:glycosyltransferase, group 1 family protein [Acinetobacter radioresistens SK82]|uniref:Glycosyltransferase, group 1 family protein n=1 Tax=Acinetobacter radioresistens SK82 TaxID=596318 RepID=A0ABM9YKZ8_ACIRA|nr:glycosyltransferase [Acinetobacter radioresistens]EET81501.1 glycosyltransferase, group 1 family protein [Acinetobacter radioresistens SK82]QMU04006.1 glycosyltransferase [Acinetobacter radioresistens]